ncbi:MAG: hypothetical protein LC789_14460 [Actinobacteria bacterium]|nr:hypothetical protein [Actinomycetota bacterium]MCA1720796.1 hypothetical protein [Actinomycetota bacterium]
MFADLPPHHDVFVLGAGFSRAVSDRMPLTDELGNACLAFNDLRGAQGVPGTFTGGRFETWLSSIAEPQPYLSEARNLANQSVFVRFSDAIGQVLGRRVNDVLAGPAPGWLVKFVTAAHARRATVVTFNYDTLVECAVSRRGIWLPTLAEPVAWTEVTGDVPGWPAGSTRLAATPADTFRLLKLHGSLNWFWTPGDTTGMSVARRPLPGAFQAPEPYTEEDRRRQLPARTPFVVPPSATKSSYYRNGLVRELWLQAGEALAAASRVSLIGYSLPQTDLTVTGMLGQATAGKQTPVHVVDPQPGPIVSRLAALGLDATAERGGTPVQGHVMAYCEAISRELVGDLRATAPPFADAPLMIAWGPDAVSTVVGFAAHRKAVLLDAEPPQPFEAAARTRSAALPTLAAVLAATPDGGHWSARADGTDDAELLGRVERVHDMGYGAGLWNVMLPSMGRAR